MLKPTDIIEGVQNFVINWARVKKGENILIVADTIADPMVVDLIATIAKGQGGRVVVSWIDYNPRQAQGGGPIIDAALKGADKILRMTFNISHDTGTVKAIMEHGGAMYSVCNTVPEFFFSSAARFPVEITQAICRRTLEKIWRNEKSKVRVTDPKGTDLVGEGWAGDWGGDFQNPDFKWDIGGVYPRTFPGCVVGLMPPSHCSGVAYFDSFSGVGITKEIKLTYKDNRCVAIDGGQEAEKVKTMIDGVPFGDYVVEIMFGVNPKIRSNAPLDQKPIPNESERRSGRIHIAIGNRPLRGKLWEEMKDVKRPYKGSHLDGFLVKPSLYINDEPLIEDGHLTVLDDPEVIKIAKKYGDPKELLTEAGPE